MPQEKGDGQVPKGSEFRKVVAWLWRKNMDND